MKITRRQLSKVISILLEESGVEVQPRIKKDRGISSSKKLAGIIIFGTAGDIIKNVTAILQAANNPANITADVKSLKSLKYLKKIFPSVSSQIDKVKTGLSFLSPFLVFALVHKTFSYLPNMMSDQLQELDTIEGVLLELRKMHNRPLKPSDISTSSAGETILGRGFTRKEIIDYIAVTSEYTKIGRSFYGTLIAGEHRSRTGQRKRGPIIDQEFAVMIQKRRKEIKEEAAKKLKDSLTASLENIPEEELKILEGLMPEILKA